MPPLLPTFVSGEEASKPQHFDSKGVSIQYTVEGQGEPVVLIHGLTSSARLNWGAPGIIAALAKNFQVIAMDVRGHGGSDKPKEETAYVEPEEVSLVADPVVSHMNAPQLEKAIQATKKRMEAAAKDLDFMEAARMRDEMFALQKMLASKK